MAVDPEGDDFGTLFCFSGNPNLTQRPHRTYSPIGSAVDFAADERLQQCADVQLSLSQFHFNEEISSNTSVLNFTKSEPDYLTGPATTPPLPITTMPSLGTVAVKGKQTSEIKIPSPDQTPSHPKLPRQHLRILEHAVVSLENRPTFQVSHTNEISVPMATIPEAPSFGRLFDGSDFSSGAVAANTKAGEPTTDPEDPDAFDSNQISPTSNVPPRNNSDLPPADGNSPVNSLEYQAPVPASADVNTTDTHPTHGIDDLGSVLVASDSIVVCKTTNRSSIQNGNEVDHSAPALRNLHHSASGDVGQIEDSLMDAVLPLYTTVPGVPRDITGELPSPSLEAPKQSKAPHKRRRRRRMLRAGQRFYRRVRVAVLRRRVLVLILGRQLAGPTKDHLLAISRGIPVNAGGPNAASQDDPPSVLA